MKKPTSSIKLLLTASVVGILAVSSVAQAKETDITCKNVENYSVKFPFEETPFIDFDFDKTVEKLSTENAEMVRKLMADMESLLDKMEKTDPLSVADEEVLMVKIAALEEEMEAILDEEGVDPVEINLLDQLSRKDRKKAIKTWCEIAEMMDDEEKRMEKKFDKLDSILSRASN